MDAFTGEIRIFTGTFAPIDWALCTGQLLSIQSYRALYDIIGNNYGGDGKTNFALPDLRDRVGMGLGTAPNLTAYPNVGKTGGAASYSLDQKSMPAHTHDLLGTSAAGAVTTPAKGYFGTVPEGTGVIAKYTKSAGTTVYLNPATIGYTGTADVTPVSNLQPYLAVNFIICLNGIFPR